MHQRKLIRDKVVALLAGATDVGTRVFPHQFRPLDQTELPCILVYAKSEPVQVYQESPRQYQRDLSIQIEIVAQANESLEDTLDAIAAQVESKLMQDHTLGDLAGDVILTGSEISTTVNGDTLIGSCALTYLMPWFSNAFADSIADNGFTNFDGIDVRYRIDQDAPSGGDATDTVDLTT